MKFPTWVERTERGRKLPDEVVAANRLRFIMVTASLHKGGEGTIAGFAKCGAVERARLYQYMNRGSFPQKLAERLEAQFGRDLLPKEHLVFPLQIAASE